ncbi:hypothetical protein [Inquilinus sp. CA228]|uniref:hypothetical protein n=1 Tax=Inquilinus sp. CA228 TaxID=3455609 RepID=UPI003F8D641B
MAIVLPWADTEKMTRSEQPNPRHRLEIAAKRVAIGKGIASADAGRVVPYEDVRRWLLSWGTKDELPPPECP